MGLALTCRPPRAACMGTGPKSASGKVGHPHPKYVPTSSLVPAPGSICLPAWGPAWRDGAMTSEVPSGACSGLGQMAGALTRLPSALGLGVGGPRQRLPSQPETPPTITEPPGGSRRPFPSRGPLTSKHTVISSERGASVFPMSPGSSTGPAPAEAWATCGMRVGVWMKTTVFKGVYQSPWGWVLRPPIPASCLGSRT